MDRLWAIAAVVVIGVLGLGFGALITTLGSSVVDDHGHAHGPDTHEHDPDGEITGGIEIPEPPDVEAVLEPVLNDTGSVVVSLDGTTEAWVDSAAVTAAREQWIANGGDLEADPPPDVSGGDWFSPPTEHPLDPRWYVLFTDA